MPFVAFDLKRDRGRAKSQPCPGSWPGPPQRGVASVATPGYRDAAVKTGDVPRPRRRPRCKRDLCPAGKGDRHAATEHSPVPQARDTAATASSRRARARQLQPRAEELHIAAGGLRADQEALKPSGCRSSSRWASASSSPMRASASTRAARRCSCSPIRSLDWHARWNPDHVRLREHHGRELCPRLFAAFAERHPGVEVSSGSTTARPSSSASPATRTISICLRSLRRWRAW